MIYTGRYQDRRLNDADHHCVRTTRGAPRFRLAYSLDAELEEIKPPPHVFGLTELAQFRPRYEAHLREVGAQRIQSRLQELEAQAGDRPVMLLCFCDLESASFCHRRVFAWWYAKQPGGRVIPEFLP